MDHTAFALFALDNNSCPFLQFLYGISGNLHTFAIEHGRIAVYHDSNRSQLACSLLWRVPCDDIGMFPLCIRCFADNNDLASTLKERIDQLWQLLLYIFRVPTLFLSMALRLMHL